jgi:hypothetical protein
MSDSPAGSVAPALPARKRIPVSVVAPTLNLSSEYFVKCIKARRNEAYRLRLRIPTRTIESLPLLHWEKRGRAWEIEEPQLLAQL